MWLYFPISHHIHCATLMHCEIQKQKCHGACNVYSMNSRDKNLLKKEGDTGHTLIRSKLAYTLQHQFEEHWNMAWSLKIFCDGKFDKCFKKTVPLRNSS